MSTALASPLGRLLPRRAEPQVRAALQDTRVVLINGARQSGKSTGRAGRGNRGKAGSTVREEDFRGLRHFADRLGGDFIVGLVLYTGSQTLPFGPRLRAMPISALWQAGPCGCAR